MSSELAAEKLFYERFWALHSDPVMVPIYRVFGVEPFRRSCVLEGFEPFLRARGFSGMRCVEIGTWKGLTALVLARYFREVISIDTRPDPERERIAQFSRVKNIRFLTAPDEGDKAAILAAENFDAAFMDGDHAHNTESDFALVQRCGRVLFHEYWPAQPAVMALVDSLRPNVATQGKFALWTS